jgi:putative salt-induced outer membrane protein YdiY
MQSQRLNLAIYAAGFVIRAAACLALCGIVCLGRADILVGANGDRLVGKVVEETAGAVVFDSEMAGRLTIPRSRISEIQRTTEAVRLQSTSQPPRISPKDFHSAGVTNTEWRPPGVGVDGSDWIQLKSGEWLKGRLRYIQQRQVEFDSDELEDQSLNLRDVRQVYPARPLFTKFDNREQIFGTVSISNDVVEVTGPEQLRLPRDQLTGITPGGNREIDFWSGSLDVSLSLQAGNTKQASLSVSAELERRTPATLAQLNYLANFSMVEGVENANNQRLTGTYDIRLNRYWFVRPVYLEYYRDALANIAHQGTLAVGVGYFIFDRDRLEWKVSGGPGYQRTVYETVEQGQSDTASTPAGVLQTYFKTDLTRRLKFTETIGFTLTSADAGLYAHHAVSTLEFEIKRHLNLNVSFVWDYLQNPRSQSSGDEPKHSDFRLNVGVGVEF